jgi:hypothetical protein
MFELNQKRESSIQAIHSIWYSASGAIEWNRFLTCALTAVRSFVNKIESCTTRLIYAYYTVAP